MRYNYREGLLLIFFSHMIMMKKWLLLKIMIHIKARVQKPYPIFLTKMAEISKINTLFGTKAAGKPYPLGPNAPI